LETENHEILTASVLKHWPIEHSLFTFSLYIRLIGICKTKHTFVYFGVNGNSWRQVIDDCNPAAVYITHDLITAVFILKQDLYYLVTFRNINGLALGLSLFIDVVDGLHYLFNL